MSLVADISAILYSPEDLGLSTYSRLIFVFQCHETFLSCCQSTKRQILSALSTVEGAYEKRHKPICYRARLICLCSKRFRLGRLMAPDIAQRIQQVSQDVLRVGQGSLYPALHRLEAQGWIASEWGASENNRKAKYYKLTAAGRKQLAAETETWRLFTGAVELILKTP